MLTDLISTMQKLIFKGENMGRETKKRKRRAHQINDDLKGAKHRELDSIKILIENGGASKGYSELIRYIEKYPTDPYGHHLLGKILLRNNDLAGARREFEKVANAHDKNRHSGLCGLARAYYLEGDLDNARHYYEEAINHNPYSHLVAYLALANLESESHNYYRALNVLYKALEVDDTHSKRVGAGSKNDIKLEIIKNLIYLEKNDEAASILATIIPESMEQEREIDFRKGSIYRDKKQYQEALACLEKVRDTQEKDSIYYLATLEISRLYQQLGMFEEQYSCLEELDEANIDFDGDVYILLGTAKLAKKDYKGAKETFKKGISSADFASRNLSAFYYSSLQHLEGDNVGAEITLRSILEKNKAPYHLNYTILIRILYNQGRYAEARGYINEIRAIDVNADDDYSFRRLEILINKQEGKSLPPKGKYGYIENQFIEYSLEDAIRHIESHHNSNQPGKANFPVGTDISQIIEDAQVLLTEDNKLMNNVLDEYEIPYPNAGYVGDQIKDHIRIKTIPGTKQIVTMHPCNESLLPTIGEIKQEKARYKLKQNDRISRFNARLEKFEQNKK